MNHVRLHMAVLFKVSESLACLDVLCALSQYSIQNATCTIRNREKYSYHLTGRPEFGETLAIREGRHPVCEQLSEVKFNPTDAFVTDYANFQILTGPNMVSY